MTGNCHLQSRVIFLHPAEILKTLPSRFLQGGTPEITDLISPDSDFHSRSRGHLVAGQPSDGSSPSAVAWRKHAPSSELDDVDSGKGFNGLPSVEPDAGYGLGTAWLDEDVTFAFSAPTSRLDTGLWNSFSFSADDAVSGGNVARIDEGQKQTGNTCGFRVATLCRSSFSAHHF